MSIAKNTGSYPFALDRDNLCAALRTLADDIEAGVVIPHSVTQNTRNTLDDYEIKHFVLRYTRRMKDGDS